VALTFDAEHPDRPTEPGVTGRILDGLASAGVPATFFLQGRWAEAEPSLAARVARDGHLVGNHSHHHARMTILTAAGLRRDVRAAEAAIRAATGADPRPWFRCPFGAGAGTARVADGLAALGYVDVGWHVDGRDWAGGSPARLEDRVVRGVVAHGDGAVVLLHGWPMGTPIALPGIVGRLRDAGATFVRLDSLDAVPGRRSTAGHGGPDGAAAAIGGPAADGATGDVAATDAH
jgi:peptidoglycan/xylan/chitin deacetylase (PgdA/CDA1 family)